MEVEKEFITDEAKELLSKDKLIQQAYPKGSDGMSKRSIKKWKDKVENK